MRLIISLLTGLILDTCEHKIFFFVNYLLLVKINSFKNLKEIENKIYLFFDNS